jgi:DNA-binding response OmpR family regulator
MVVDNDRTTLEMIQIRLDVAGFHPLTARSSFGALEVLKTSRPAVLILERNMPEMDGIQLLRELSSIIPANRMFPVLLVGRSLAADDVRAAVSLGVRDVLAKPFSGAAVLERVTRLLKKTNAPPATARTVVYV